MTKSEITGSISLEKKLSPWEKSIYRFFHCSYNFLNLPANYPVPRQI